MLLVFKKRNNLIIQWGVTPTKTGAREINEKITFSAQFSNTNYAVICSPNMWTNGTTYRQAAIGVHSKNKADCVISFYGASTSDTGTSINWIAIGY